MFNSYKKYFTIGLLLLGGSFASMAQTARVQVIHNSPDDIADSVDVYLNGNLLIDNFAFRNASPFIDAPAGVQLDLDIAPKTSTSVSQSISNTQVTLMANSTYVVVADGITGLSSTSYNPAPAFELKVYAMGREAASQSGNTDVLVHHGSTDAPTVDVSETSVPAGNIVNNASYGDFSGYLELATNDYVLAIQDESGATNVASFDAPLATLGLQGSALVVVASGFLNPANNGNGPAFGLYAALPAGGEMVALPASKARVQVIHNSADDAASSVDVYLNGDILIDNFAFRSASAFIDAPAGVEIELDVAPGNSTNVGGSVANFPVTLESGATYIVVADGITGLSSTTYTPAPAFDLKIYDMGREAATSATNTDVLVHHGSTDAPTVDVYEVSAPAGLIVDDAAYGDFAGYLELATANYRLEIRDESGSNTVAAFDAPLDDLNLDGVALTVVASGFLNPGDNGNGPAFGLYVALPAGGNLVALPNVTSTNEITKTTFKLFPNPVQDELQLQIEDNAPASITISTILGDIVKRSTGNINRIDVSDLPAGVYSIAVETSKGQNSQLFVKQ